MIETERRAHELDIVELTEDLPEFGLRRGERGTAVEAFDHPEEAYVLTQDIAVNFLTPPMNTVALHLAA